MRNIILNYYMKILISLILCALSTMANAGFEEGTDAYLKGDYKKAAREWTLLANNGNPNAARNLARLYFEGNGVSKNHELARSWYRFAADLCNATAMNNLGLMYLNGQGGPIDPEGAFRLFQRAANMGIHEDSDAMGNLASLYMQGLGTQANIIEAYKWYVLYGQYTTDTSNRQKLSLLLPFVEAQMTRTQIKEGLRRSKTFFPIPCN